MIHSHGVIQCKIYDTDTEYELARKLHISEKQFYKCERAFLIVASGLLIAVLFLIFKG